MSSLTELGQNSIGSRLEPSKDARDISRLASLKRFRKSEHSKGEEEGEERDDARELHCS